MNDDYINADPRYAQSLDRRNIWLGIGASYSER